MRSRALVPLLVPFVSAALFAACSGTDSTVGSDDAGSPDGSSSLDGTTSTTDGSTPQKDGGGAADAGQTSDGSMDSGPLPFDAGSPLWQPDPPTDAGTTTMGDTFADSDCTFALGVIQVGGPPSYTLFLQKKDTTAGSCKEPKGYVTIVTSVNYAPAAFLARVPGEKLLAVTYDYKTSLSGSSPVFAGLEQRGWYGGHLLHQGAFGLKGADAGGPPPPGKGSTFVTALTFTGHDAKVTGSGYFPGAPNNDFVATYNQFVSNAYQTTSLADAVQ